MQYHVKAVYLNVITYSIDELKLKSVEQSELDMSNEALKVNLTNYT
jgi:hypothetical protein